MIGLAPAVAVTLGGVYAIVACGSVAAAILGRRRDDETTRELAARVRSWWLIIVALTAVLLIGHGAATVFLAFVSFLALKEFLSCIPTRRVDRETLLWVYLCIPVQFYFAYIDWYGMFIVFIPVWAYLFIAMVMVLRGDTAGFLNAVGTLSWGLMMTVFTLSHLAFLLVAGARGNPIAGGEGLLLFVLVACQANDVAQYVWGRSLGRRKIVPKVSPGKTWEGFLGGVATTAAVAGVIGPQLTAMDWRWSLAAGAMVAAAGFVGDITMSALKRDLGIKDFSMAIPGHGGVLDRVDSLTIAVPVFTHAYRFFFMP